MAMGIDCRFSGQVVGEVENKLVKNGTLEITTALVRVDDRNPDNAATVKVVTYGDKAADLAASARTGDRISVEGKLVTSTWTDKKGNEHQSVTVTASKIAH